MANETQIELSFLFEQQQFEDQTQLKEKQRLLSNRPMWIVHIFFKRKVIKKKCSLKKKLSTHLFSFFSLLKMKKQINWSDKIPTQKIFPTFLSFSSSFN